MANINYNDYEKNQQDQSPGEKITKTFSMGSLKTTDTQYYVEEDNVLLDFIEIDFGEKQGIGVEVWMSYLGEDFKMKVDMITKDEYEKIIKDKKLLGNMIGGYVLDNLDCLKCKSDILCDLCKIMGDEEDD